MLQLDLVLSIILYPWVSYIFLHREAISLLNDAAERLSDYLVYLEIAGFKAREITV